MKAKEGTTPPEETVEQKVTADKAILTAEALAVEVENRAEADAVKAAIQAKVGELTTLKLDDWTVGSTTYEKAENDEASTQSVTVKLSSTSGSVTDYEVASVTVTVKANGEATTTP